MTTSHYTNAGKVTDANMRNAAKESRGKVGGFPPRFGSYGVAPCETTPSVSMVDPFGLLMVAILRQACEEFTSKDFATAVHAFDFLMNDGGFYLEALDIEAEIREWLSTINGRQVEFNYRGINRQNYGKAARRKHHVSPFD